MSKIKLMGKRSIAILVALMLVFSFLSTSKRVEAATSYVLNTTVNTYMTAQDAALRVKPVGHYSEGNYFVFFESQGMKNISKVAGSAGAWINPEDNLPKESQIKAWLSDAVVSPAPYKVGENITVNVTPYGEASKINEYALMIDGTVIGSYTTSTTLSTKIPNKAEFKLTVVSRNKVTHGKIEDSRTFSIKTNSTVAPSIKAWISDAVVSPAPYKQGANVTVNVTPYGEASKVNEYALMIDGIVKTSYTTSTTLSAEIPEKSTFKLTVVSRNRLTHGIIEDSRSFTLTTVGAAAPAIKAWISDAVVSPAPYNVGSNVTVNVTPYGEASKVNEYALMIDGIVKTSYTTSTTLSVEVPAKGTFKLSVVSRNRLTHGVIEDSRSFNLTTVGSAAPTIKAWMADATISSGPYRVGDKITINITPYLNGGTISEYTLLVDGVTYVPFTTSTTLSMTIPSKTQFALMVVARNKNTKGPIEDSRTFTINTVTSDQPRAYLKSVSVTPGTYSVQNPISVTAIALNPEITEYSVDDITSGSPIRIINWQLSGTFKIVPDRSGLKTYRVNTRNKQVGGSIDDSKTFSVNVMNSGGYVNIWNATPTSYRIKYEAKDKNLYSQASTSSSVIIPIKGGDVMDLVQNLGTFSKVNYKGKVGYVMSDSIEKTKQLTGPIKPTTGNGKVIYLESGHDYATSGAKSLVLGYTLYEGLINWNVTVKVRDMLQSKGYTVFTSKTKVDQYTEFYDNFYFANQAEVDLVISIHQNSLYNDQVKGTLAFYSSDQINLTKKGAMQENIRLAEIAARNVGSYFGSGKIVDDMSYGGSFAVNRITDAPSILLECGFISNREDALKMATDVGQQYIADKIVLTVEEFFRNMPQY